MDLIAKETSEGRFENVPVLRCKWISECVKNKSLMNTDPFLVHTLNINGETSAVTPEKFAETAKNVAGLTNIIEETDNSSSSATVQSFMNLESPDEVMPSTSSLGLINGKLSNTSKSSDGEKNPKYQSFVCARASGSKAAGVNSGVTAELKKLLEVTLSNHRKIAGLQMFGYI